MTTEIFAISQNIAKFLIVTKVAKTRKSCLKHWKLPESCRATCGQGYLNPFSLHLPSSPSLLPPSPSLLIPSPTIFPYSPTTFTSDESGSLVRYNMSLWNSRRTNPKFYQLFLPKEKCCKRKMENQIQVQKKRLPKIITSSLPFEVIRAAFWALQFDIFSRRNFLQNEKKRVLTCRECHSECLSFSSH